jgi:tetratricopeptide (TPR) repeat protein
VFALQGLSADDARVLVRRRAGSLPAETQRRICEIAAGHPLMLLQLAALCAERAAARADGATGDADEQGELPLPMSVRELVDAELALVEAAHVEILEAAAVIGPRFTVGLVAAATERPAARVDEVLHTWIRRGLVRSSPQRGGDASSGALEFSHDLYRLALRERVSSAARVRLQKAIANAMLSGGTPPAGRPTVALADDPAVRVAQLRQSGEAAAAKAEYAEACRLLGEALATLRRLPQTSETVTEELEIRMLLGNTLGLNFGDTSLRMAHEFRHALSLADRLDNPLVRLRAQLGLCAHHLYRADYARTIALADEVITAAATAAPPALPLALLYRGLGEAMVGRLDHAVRSLDEALALPRLADIPKLLDFGAVAAASFAVVRAIRGELHPAAAMTREAVEATARSNKPMTAGFIASLAAHAAAIAGDLAQVVWQSTVVARLAERFAIPGPAAEARVLLGYANALGSTDPAAASAFRDALGLLERSGRRLLFSRHCAFGVRVYLHHGQPAAARILLDNARVHVASAREHFYEADLVMLDALCTLAETGPDEVPDRVEDALRAAMRIATERGTPLVGLEAACRLAELLRGRKRSDEAATLLRVALEPFGAQAAPGIVADAHRLVGELERSHRDG